MGYVSLCLQWQALVADLPDKHGTGTILIEPEPHWGQILWINKIHKSVVLVGGCKAKGLTVFANSHCTVTQQEIPEQRWRVTYPGLPACSILLAIMTSRDQTSYCHLHIPRRPLRILPEWIPMRMSRVSLSFLSSLKIQMKGIKTA